VKRELGLGWSYLLIDNVGQLKDLLQIIKSSNTLVQMKLDIFRGSPRSLLFNVDHTLAGGSSSIMENGSLEYSLFFHKPLLKCNDLIPPFVFFDERNGSESICGVLFESILFL
jgi:hypothetical protein